MRFLIALLASIVFMVPSISFGETWHEFLNKKKADEAKGGLLNKGARKIISKDLIVRQLKEEGQAVFESDCINFDYGSWKLRSGTEDQIAEIAAAIIDSELKDVPYFYVDGHTCSIGTNENNCRLSNLRAQSVIDLLVLRAGIPTTKLIARGFGENVPAHSNDTEESRQLNRRVVLKSAYEETPQDRANRCSLSGASETQSEYDETASEDTGEGSELEDKGDRAPKGWKKTYIPGTGSSSEKAATTVRKGTGGSQPPKGFRRSDKKGVKEDRDAPAGWKRVR